MNKKYLSVLVLAIALIGLGIFISKHNTAPLQDISKLQVAASFYPLYFFASGIGGDKAEVTNITPAGAEPHDYEPTAKDIATIEESNLLILNGGGLEAWGDDIRKNIDGSHTSVLVTGEGLANKEMVEEGEKMTDPHIWLAPELAKQMVDRINASFAQADPQNKDYYAANADVLKQKLGTLDTTFHKGLENCQQKNIITSHAAFAYMAEYYGLTQIPIAGLSPEAEPSPKELGDIAKFAKSNNVKYIFFESLVSPKLSETIAKEIGAQTLVLNPIEGLTEEDIAAGKNYFTEMQNNLKNLQLALECKTL